MVARFGHYEKVHLKGLTLVEKQALHCTLYQAGFKPVGQHAAKYIL